MSETVEVPQSRVIVPALSMAQTVVVLSEIHFLHRGRDCLCAVESYANGASCAENPRDSTRAVLGQSCGLARCGSESVQKVQSVFEALKLLFSEAVVDVIVPQKADHRSLGTRRRL